MVEPGWTGKSEKCSEYGKPPTALDPESQEAVVKLTRIRALIVAAFPTGVVDGDGPASLTLSRIIAEFDL